MFRINIHNVLGVVLATGLLMGAVLSSSPNPGVFALTPVAQTMKSQDMSFYAYGPLTTAIVSAYGHVGNGKYCRQVVNTTGHKTTVRFIRVKSGEGSTFVLKKHQQRKLCVELGSSARTHYAILLMSREITWSAGVWTPQASQIHYANKNSPGVIVCSRNPLKRPAILNVLKATMSGSWHNADHSYYVAPGHKVCLAAHQPPNRYMRLRSDWRHGKQRFTLTYQVAPAYTS